MEDKMLRVMATDLGITQYETENDVQYRHRVLYSALACWIKAASMDCPITGSINTTLGINRRHIHDKCSAVLSEMLKRFPNCKRWFDTGDVKESPVIMLRSRLLRHGDLVNVGFSTNVALAAPGLTQLTRSLVCVKGSVLQDRNTYSGVANINVASYDKGFAPEPIQAVDKWFNQYIKSAWWHQSDLSDEGVEYFNPHKKSKNNHTCWQTALPQMTINIILARRGININAYEYMLYKPVERKIHRIDPALQDFGEHHRFMIGLRALSGNPVPIQVICYSDHITLRLRIHLPTKENVLLESYAWPHRSIADRLEWDMLPPVWEYIMPYLAGLRMEITEETYG